MAGSDRKCGCSDTLDIVDTFSPTFINPIFGFSPVVKYENMDYKKSEIFKQLSIFTYSQIQKLEVQKSEILIQTSILLIFTYSQIRKLG